MKTVTVAWLLMKCAAAAAAGMGYARRMTVLRSLVRNFCVCGPVKLCRQ